MNKSERELGIEINIAKPTDLAEFSKLLGNVFSERDPPAVEYISWLLKLEALANVFGAKSIQEKLSLVARSKDTGKVIGAVLAHDFGTAPSSDVEALVPFFEPLLALLEQLDSKYTATKSVVAGEFLHVFMIAVDDSWSGKGVAQMLIHDCILNGSQSGYQIAFTETTSEASRCVFRNNGFQEQHFVRYEDFEFQGSRPFASIHEHKGCALMDTKIS